MARRNHRHPSSVRPALAYPGTNGTRTHKCHYCGRANHGTNENGRISKANREVKCPAFTATCNKCSLTGHFSAVCRKRTPQKWGKADKLGSKPNSGYNEKMTSKSEDSASATDRSVYEDMCGASISQPCGIPADGAHACDGDTNVKTMAIEEMAHITSIGSRGSGSATMKSSLSHNSSTNSGVGLRGQSKASPQSHCMPGSTIGLCPLRLSIH